MPVKINLLQITSSIQQGEEPTPDRSGGNAAISQEQLADLEARILEECMQMILNALESQQER